MQLPLSAGGRSAEDVARLCAREAGRIIMAHFGRHEQMVAKGRGNFVTEADLAAERAVLDLLRQEYPGHAVLSEETASDVADAESLEWLWVVDPLDGTHNFSKGVPYFAFNIALCQHGEPVLGLTYAPVTGEEFLARQGAGLTVNGEPARASSTGSLRESVLGMDLGYDDQRAAKLIALLAELWPGMQSVRVMGSAALGLAYAACGRYDLFVHHFLYPWDIAAGIALVREAGGMIVDRDGGPVRLDSGGVVAGAPGAVADFLRLAARRAWR
ncbi:MAG TPA: inositol monophosphatase family protein [Dehalococcoidia bacterium]|nr:inositol monophosphatase family protein [Dehalococcoidia bacterium]